MITESPTTLSRRQLYDLVWKEPVQILATRFGLSDRGLAKLCERNAIPTPPRGYWARKQAGQKVTRAPLIELDRPNGAPDFPVLRIAAKASAPAASDVPDPLVAFWTEQRDEIGAIATPARLVHPHPVIAAWIAEDEKHRAFRSQWGGSGAYKETPLERRRLRILSALYKALEARGVKVVCERNARVVEFRHGSVSAEFDLKEYVQQKRRPLTDVERAESWNASAKWRQEQCPTGRLRGRVNAFLPSAIPVQWAETETQSFESLLGEVVATVLTALARAKAEADRRHAEEVRRWEAQKAAQKREEELKAERAREQALRSRAKAWREASDVRAFVAAVQTAAAGGDFAAAPADLASWSEWALAHAATLDPIVAGDALRTD